MSFSPDPALHLDRKVALRNVKNELLAVLTMEQIYEWDPAEVAQKGFWYTGSETSQTAGFSAEP